MDGYCRAQYVLLDVVLLMACTFNFSDSNRGIFISQTIVSRGKGQVTNVSSNVVIYSKAQGMNAKTPREPSRRTNVPSPSPLPSPHLYASARPTPSRLPASSGLSVVPRSHQPRTIPWIPVRMYSREKTSGWVFVPVQSFPGLTSTSPSQRLTRYEHRTRKKSRVESIANAGRRTAFPYGSSTTQAPSTNATKAKLWSRLLKRLRRTTVAVTSTCQRSTTGAIPAIPNPAVLQRNYGNYIPELAQEDQQIDYGQERRNSQQYYDYPSRMDWRRYRRYKRDVGESSTMSAKEDVELNNDSTGYNGTGQGRERRQAIDRDTRAVFLFFTVLMLLSLAAMVWYTPSEPLGGSRHFIRLKPRHGEYTKLPTFDPGEETRFLCAHCMAFQESNITTSTQPMTFKSIATAKLLAHRLTARCRAQHGKQQLLRQQTKEGRNIRPRPKTSRPPSSSLSADIISAVEPLQKSGQRNAFRETTSPSSCSHSTGFGYQAAASTSNVASLTSASGKTTGRLRVVLGEREGDSKATSNIAKFVVNDVPECTKRVVLQVQLKRKLPHGGTQVYCKEVTFNFDQ